MLTSIEDLYRDEALVLLRWLAYAQSPPTLAQLAEAVVIDLSDGVTVDIANRGSLEDTLEIFGGLVIIEEPGHNGDGVEKLYDWLLSDRDHDADRSNNSTRNPEHVLNRDIESAERSRPSSSHGSDARGRSAAKIRLAHFSIQEYLESDRILQTAAKGFHLNRTMGHSYLARCCLVYVSYCCKSTDKRLAHEDLENFPLLEYAACSWIHHFRTSPDEDTTVLLASELLSSNESSLSWITIAHSEDLIVLPIGSEDDYGKRLGLYYASEAGLNKLVISLLGGDSDVNAQGGPHGSALMAAAFEGHEKVIGTLIDRGANLNTDIGFYGNALHAASANGRVEAVRTLLQAGADVNATGGRSGNALQAASRYKHTAVVEVLLQHQANANARGGRHDSALQAAAHSQSKEIVRILLDAGADPNLQGGYYGSALHAAVDMAVDMASGDRLEIPRMLISAGANVNIKSGRYDSVLELALSPGNKQMVQELIAAGANVNIRGNGEYGNPLQSASFKGFERLVEVLLKAGANANARGGTYGYALSAAAASGHEKVVEMLIAAGADVNAEGGIHRTPLQAAAYSQHLQEKQIRTRGYGPESEQAVELRRYQRVIRMLLDAGAVAEQGK